VWVKLNLAFAPVGGNPGPIRMSRAQSYIEQLLRQRQRESPSGVWLKFSSETFTWNDVITLSQGAANGLLDLGASPGDRIGIMAANKPEFLWFYFGALMIGAKVVPLNEWQELLWSTC
jgi:crotonobetaine/carnitine-CoA ligase